MSVDGTAMRTFVAVELDDRLKEALAQYLSVLQRAKPPMRLKWVQPENQHLTLQFLGEIAEADVTRIAETLQKAVGGIAPFDIALRETGCFPSPSRPNVLWVGLHEPGGALIRLQQSVSAQLARVGFTPEERGFTPHLTLARVPREAKPAERRALGEWFVKQPPPASQSMRVAQVHLMLSELRPAGAQYTPLRIFALQNAVEYR